MELEDNRLAESLSCCSLALDTAVSESVAWDAVSLAKPAIFGGQQKPNILFYCILATEDFLLSEEYARVSGGSIFRGKDISMFPFRNPKPNVLRSLTSTPPLVSVSLLPLLTFPRSCPILMYNDVL